MTLLPLGGGAWSGLSGLQRRLVSAAPAPFKRALAGPYNRLLVRRADRAFRGRSLPECSRSADAPDHVVIVVVDALRADAVTDGNAPFLADRTVASAVTPSPWTFPAVSSLLTGRYPHEHGAMRQSDDADSGATDLTVPPTIPESAPTLADVLAGAGYDTYGAFAFHMPFFALGGRFQRHAVYDDAPAGDVLADYLDWAGEAGQRTAAYLHLGDLHEPVDPPADYWDAHGVDPGIDGIGRWRFEADPEPDEAGRRFRRHRRRLYHAAVDAVDDELAAFAARLDDVLDGDVCLVVTGDHGEGLWEHAATDAGTFVDSRPAYCVDHGGTPYECIARVPLAVEGFPGLSPGDVGRFAARPSLVDVAPTLARVVGVESALPTTGVDLRDGVPADRIPLVEATRYGHERKAAYLGDWKVVVSRGDDVVAGFSLPEESRATLPDALEERLLAALPPWPEGGEEEAVSGLARERLEDLGYV